MKKQILKLSVVTTLLSGMAASQSQAQSNSRTRQIDIIPCACRWDGATKEYPNGQYKVNTFKTTVEYVCGYTCYDSRGNEFNVKGRHKVSFWFGEDGDEVVCEGLKYRSHDTPFGNRMSAMMWDGIIRPFMTSQSSSPDVKAWGRANGCAQ